MKIVSQFHDYYDTVLAYGHDNDGYVYDRVTKVVKIPEDSPVCDDVPFRDYRVVKIGLEYEFIYVGFCGKIYPVLKIIKDNIPTYFYTMDKVNGWIESNYSKKLVKQFNEQNTSFHRYNLLKRETSVFEFSQIMLNKYLDITHDKFFLKLQTPVFVFDTVQNKTLYGFTKEAKLTINPCLNDLQFYKTLGIYETYGELDMYVSGVLAPQPIKIDELSDARKLLKKGFDKWTFKKLPTKKRKSK